MRGLCGGCVGAVCTQSSCVAAHATAQSLSLTYLSARHRATGRRRLEVDRPVRCFQPVPRGVVPMNVSKLTPVHGSIAAETTAMTTPSTMTRNFCNLLYFNFKSSCFTFTNTIFVFCIFFSILLIVFESLSYTFSKMLLEWGAARATWRGTLLLVFIIGVVAIIVKIVSS